MGTLMVMKDFDEEAERLQEEGLDSLPRRSTWMGDRRKHAVVYLDVERDEGLFPVADMTGNTWLDYPTTETATTRRVRRALLSLSPRHQEVLHSRFWDQQSIGDIAKERGVTRRAVRTLITRAQENLRKALV